MPAPDPDHRELEHWLAAIVDSSQDAIIGKDLAGVVTSWNAGATRIYGYTAEEMIGQPIARLLPPDQPDELPGIMARLRQGESIEHYETVRRRKDGTRIVVSLSVSPIRDGRGAIVGAAAIARDTTTRRRAELALHNEARLVATLYRIGRVLTAELDPQRLLQAVTDEAAAVTGAAFGVFLHRMDDRGGTSTDALPRCRVTGLTPGDFGPATRFDRNAVIRRTFVAKEVVRYTDLPGQDAKAAADLRALLPHDYGEVRSYLAVPVISRSGVCLGALLFGHRDPHVFLENHERIASGIAAWAAVAVDNARLFHAEREARARAEEADRAKMQFMAVMSHELRTPLTAIIGYTDLWLMGLPQPVSSPMRAQVERVRLSAGHLLELIEEVLTFSRVEADGGAVEFVGTTLDEIARQVVASIEPAALLKDLQLSVRCSPAAAIVHADPRKLRRILVNLLANAIKFTTQGEVGMDMRLEGGRLLIDVADTGIGIAEENLPRVFTPFWQAEQGPTRSFEGTGLGLSVAQRLARLLGGDISVESTLGVGSRFTVTLPATVPSPTPAI